VIAGDERNGPEVNPVKSEKFAVFDEVLRMLVMVLRIDKKADIVEQRRDRKQKLVARSQFVFGRKRVEHLRTHPFHMFDVGDIGLVFGGN
jgi:hypothetical protein